MHYDWQHAIAAGSEKLNADETISVDMKTGDELCNEYDFKPDIIKMDVEGHEIKVIRGLKNTISKYQPIIFLEVHPNYIAEEGESTEELVPFFKNLNYRLLSIDGCESSWSELAHISNDERYILLTDS